MNKQQLLRWIRCTKWIGDAIGKESVKSKTAKYGRTWKNSRVNKLSNLTLSISTRSLAPLLRRYRWSECQRLWKTECIRASNFDDFQRGSLWAEAFSSTGTFSLQYSVVLCFTKHTPYHLVSSVKNDQCILQLSIEWIWILVTRLISVVE